MALAGAQMNVSMTVAVLVLFLVLIQPNHPEAMTWGALLVFPLELPAIILAVVVLGQSMAGRALRLGLVVTLTLIVTLKCADFVSFAALARGFNPAADLPLVDALVRLMAGAVGPVLAGLAVISAILAIAFICWVLWWSLAQWSRVAVSPARVGLLAMPAVVAATLVVAEVGHTMGRWHLSAKPPASAFTARVGIERVVMVQNTLAKLRTFRAKVKDDAFAEAQDLLDEIDRDVLVVFVESYGRTSFDTPIYSSVHRETLSKYQERLDASGLSLRSGFLAAPTKGGQSWLSHATFANGLWVENQVSYGAVLSSGRETLFHHAAKSGFRTAAVMPQITLDWPEAERMGFEDILAAKDLGYKGLPFNWVTMPDQFTLDAMDRLLRDGDDGRNVFAQVALASSHAPWVPVPEFIPWEDIGDGQIYNEVAASGDPPDVVWRDHDRVRVQYRLAVDYALTTVLEYALRHAEAPPLLLVIGDHQAAEFVALDGRPDVPIHVIGPAKLVERLSDVAPQHGLFPPSEMPPRPMNEMRDILLTVFSSQFHQALAQ